MTEKPTVITADQLTSDFKSILTTKPRQGRTGSDYVDNLKKAQKGEIIKIDGLHYSMKNRYVRLAKNDYKKLSVLFESTSEDKSLGLTDNKIYRVVLIETKQLDKIRKAQPAPIPAGS